MFKYVLTLVLIIVLVYAISMTFGAVERDMQYRWNARCTAMLQMAHSPHDTLIVVANWPRCLENIPKEKERHN